MSQSSDSFERKILRYGTRNAKKISIKSSNICKIHLCCASHTWQTIDSIFDNSQKSNEMCTRATWWVWWKIIYYLSKKFTDYESRYTMVENLCCALVWASNDFDNTYCITLHCWFWNWILSNIFLKSLIYQAE